MKKVLFKLLAYGFFSFAISASGAIRPLSLKEAVRFALENSPGFDSAQKTKKIRELEYSSALGRMLPSADVTATQGGQNGIPIAGNSVIRSPTAPWSSALTLGVTESLYDNGVSLTKLGVARLASELADLNFLKTRDSLTLDVATTFYKYSLSASLLEVRKQQQSILEKQFARLTSQYQQGLKTKSDYLRLKTQVQRAEIDRTGAENSVASNEAELRRLLGVSYQDPTPPVFESLTVTDPEKIDHLFPETSPALEKFYDFRINRIQEEVNGKSVALAQRNYWPQVSVASGITYSNSNYLGSSAPFSASSQLSWNALLTVQYNIWDWGTRKRDVQIAGLNRDIQGNSLHQGLLDVNAQIANLKLDLIRIKKNYRLSRELLALETESNRNMEAQYREGQVTYLDLITSLNSLLDAKVQFFTSYFEALQNLSKHSYFEGNLYEAFAEK